VKYGWLMFVAGAVLTWGAYVVTIDHGRKELAQGVPPAVAAMRAFLFIGLAYFLMAVVVPGVYLWRNTPDGAAGFNSRGVVLSTVAGALGAAGALCIVFAVGAARRQGGAAGAATALYVAPLVFGFAPIVNAVLSMIWDPPAGRPSPLFFVGIVLAAVGAGMVLYFKPAETPHGAAPAGSATHAAAVVPTQTHS